jgi:hypothetical protein
MSRPPGPGQCVHCYETVETRNWDHVLPVSWYPDSTPTNMEKWKVPSCANCNKEYGKLERELLGTIGLCLDASDPEISSVVDKALSGIDPERASCRKDRRAREREREKLLGKIQRIKEVPEESVYPNFEARRDGEEYITLPVPKDGIERMARKIVKGVLYKERGMFLDDGYVINTYVLHDVAAQEIVNLISKNGEELNRGAGLSVVRATLPDDPRSGLYAITVWKKLKFYAVVEPGNIDELVAQGHEGKQEGTP